MFYEKAAFAAERDTMRYFLIAACLALSALTLSAETAEAGPCPNGYQMVRNACKPIPAPGVRYKGNANPETIRVRICHRYWHKLSGGPGKRWWGLTLKKGNWQANIREVYSECTWQNVVPGTRVGNKHNCRRPYSRWEWYWTETITQPGATYVVG